MLAITGAYNLAATGLLPATGLAIVAALALEFGGTRYLAARPLRVAVLGSPVFAAALQREVRAGSVKRFEIVGWLNLGENLRLRNGAMQIGTLDSVRAAVTEHEIDLLVRGPGTWDSNVSRSSLPGNCRGLPRPTRADDRRQPVLRAAVRPRARWARSIQTGSSI